MNKIAECNICSERIEVDEIEEVKGHYQSKHNISPLQECQRCGEKKILVESAWNMYGWKRVVASLYCEDCIEDPLEKLLVSEIAYAEEMRDIHSSKIGRPKVLSEFDVRHIKQKYETGDYTIPELAEQFDVSETVIYKAKEGDYGG